jgi:hypothetical protein
VSLRYNYFIQVDHEALQSVLATSKRDIYSEGFVDFVDSRWQPLGKERYGPVEDGEELDAIYGCTEVDVGWVRIASLMIDVD